MMFLLNVYKHRKINKNATARRVETFSNLEQKHSQGEILLDLKFSVSDLSFNFIVLH